MLYDIAQQLNCSNLRAMQVCLAAEYGLQSKTGKYWRAKPVTAKTLFLTMTVDELKKKDSVGKAHCVTFTGLCMNAIVACHQRLFSRHQVMANESSLMKYLPHFCAEPTSQRLTGASL